MAAWLGLGLERGMLARHAGPDQVLSQRRQAVCAGQAALAEALAEARGPAADAHLPGVCGWRDVWFARPAWLQSLLRSQPAVQPWRPDPRWGVLKAREGEGLEQMSAKTRTPVSVGAGGRRCAGSSGSAAVTRAWGLMRSPRGRRTPRRARRCGEGLRTSWTLPVRLVPGFEEPSTDGWPASS